MAVITISRLHGSGGRKLGRVLARRLNFQYVEKSLFQKIAEDLNVSEKTLESFEKSREYRISNLFSNVFNKGYIQRIVGHDKTVVEEQEYQNSLRKLILGIAQEDNVVIVGRAAYFFLKDTKNCYHVRLVASMDWRKKHAVEKLGIPKDGIQSILEKNDTNQIWFHRLICGENFDNPYFFHISLNMDFIAHEKAVELLKSLVNS
jgi:cytidylate kinase